MTNRRTDSRPDPDALLETVERERGFGRLKIFFGAAPGVGKTYAMLEAAQRDLRSGRKVLVGYVEPHQRPETTALLEGLPSIPPKVLVHRGVTLQELDLEEALLRQPELILVDELAHTNAPGSANEKRWQDVQHLLRAGIDVYSTLNVQHLESINDLVTQSTGITVRETIPDSVFEDAWEIELVDLPPDELISRLRTGKIYLAEQARRAQEFFFQKANLVALRELALRRTAERVDTQLESYRRAQALPSIGPRRDKLVVCVGPSPFSVKLVRATKRMASSLRCPWIAVHLDFLDRPGISSRGDERVKRNLRLAERLGAETAVLTASDLVGELINFAHDRGATKVIVGKPSQPRWKEILRGSFVYTLTKRCGDLDIYVISGDSAETESKEPVTTRSPTDYRGFSLAAGIMALCTGVNALLWGHLEPTNLVMVYLLGVVAVSAKASRSAATLAALLSVAAFDFAFVPPFWTFSVSDSEYLFTFAVMMFTALVVSNLTLRLRAQSEMLKQREQRTARLLSFTRKLGECRTDREMLQCANRLIAEVVNGSVTILLGSSDNLSKRGLEPDEAPESGFQIDNQLRGVASWAFEHNQPAGRGTSVLSAASAVFIPITLGERPIGVVGLKCTEGTAQDEIERRPLLEAIIDILASALDRANLSKAAEAARLEAEGEKLRNTLLGGVSHDLRTPLAVIEGASTTLLDGGEGMDIAQRRALLETIVSESEHLNQLVGNLLDATKLEGGNLVLKREWQSIEELVGSVVHRLANILAQRRLRVQLSPDLPFILADGPLIHQVFANLLENAAKFSAHDSPIEIEGIREHEGIVIRVADRGRGIAACDLPHIFEKFYRGQDPMNPRFAERSGAGLGLAICKGIVELHGGQISAEAREGGGTVFQIWLPCETLPPEIEVEGASS